MVAGAMAEKDMALLIQQEAVWEPWAVIRWLGQSELRMRLQQTCRATPNISDLISSYPFGQLSGENNGNVLVTSPVHGPTNYGQSTLMNRGGGKNSSNNISGIDEQDELFEIEELDLTRRRLSTNNNNGGAGSSTSGSGRKSVEALPPKIAGYDTFGRISHNRASRDAQPMDLHEVLKISVNRPNDTTRNRNDSVMSSGSLSATAPMIGNSSGSAHRPSHDISLYDYYLTGPDIDPQSRKSSYGGYGFGYNRSPILCPLQRVSTNNGQQSLRAVGYPLQEMRMDSFTLLVIVDLETETSESLILHSIERGYSPSDYPPNPSLFGDNTFAVSNKDTSESPGAIETEEGTELTPIQNMSEVRHENTAIFPNNKVASTPHLLSPPIDPPTDDTQQQRQQHKRWRRIHIGSNQRLLSARGQSNETISTRQWKLSADASVLQVDPQSHSGTELEAGELPRTTESNRQSSIPNPLSAIKRFSIGLGLDFRNMDGITESNEGSERLERITSDYVVRVIPIHNQCWRVQLPDQETMDRWIEIGQQIKDENWITRPIVSSKAAHGKPMDRRRSSLDGGPNNYSRRRSSARADNGLNEDDDVLPFDFPKPRPRPREASVSLHPPRAVPHPLQNSHENNNSHSSNHSQYSQLYSQHSLQPHIPTKLTPFPRPEASTFRMHSDTTEASVSSSDTDRQKSRERAARINQQMRASSRYTPFRALIRNNNGNGSDRSGMSFGSGLSFGFGSFAPTKQQGR
ncbi:hypothetical protein BGX26_012464 [Mortierella sp. AD094]|nr:hypothetical protein BGX26_012464 [Mortierella sp. AD094]